MHISSYCQEKQWLIQYFSLYQVFEAKDNKPEIVLTIVESGHLLVLQGQESLVSRVGYCFFSHRFLCVNKTYNKDYTLDFRSRYTIYFVLVVSVMGIFFIY